MKKVCVVTSTRADYGILTPLLRRIQEDAALELQLAVTGTHLCAEHGMTVREIQADGFPIAARIPILSGGDTPQAVSETMANALCRFGAHFAKQRPDMAVVLGDRYEIFAICAALVNARIPIAHLHGGETTEGAVDECFRHSITKMAYLHFTANEAYRKRVVQLGEAPARVFDVGALGVENALHTDFLPKEALLDELGLSPASPYVVVTFHPVTLEGEGEAQSACEALLAAMDAHPELQYVCTMHRSMYVAVFFSCINLAGIALGNAVGGWLMQNAFKQLEALHFTLFGVEWINTHYIILLGSVLRLLVALLILPRINEQDAWSVRDAARDIQREQLSAYHRHRFARRAYFLRRKARREQQDDPREE